MINILKTLFNQAGLIAILAFAISQSSVIRRILTRRRKNRRDFIVIVLLFATLGILGTYTGIPIRGALANSRVVGVFVAGLIGGPLVGLTTGLIAGFHRWTIDIGGFTAVVCMVSTILEGFLGGLLHQQMAKVEEKWFFATITGALAEILQMLLILLFVKPFPEALDLLKLIAFPMIGANSVAIGIFVAIIYTVREKEDSLAADQSEVVLLIARKTIEYLRQGFNPKTAKATARIILENTDLDAVAFTNTEMIISHTGEASHHHRAGGLFQTILTTKVLKTGKMLIAKSAEQIKCSDDNCTLQSAIAIPLFQKKSVIGTMNLYRIEKNSISKVDTNMATGLGALFSTQIELSRIEEQEKLLDKAELKALQAQINPHFLFNAINTIVSLVRTDPESARTLLQQLSLFFRNNFHAETNEVSIQQEIKHIHAYLSIEKARFGENLQVVFRIPESLECQLPPFLLQPLVENAVKHGIMTKKEGGEIIIDAKEDRKNTIITISDNGKGICENDLKTIFNNEKNSSIALNNINTRLTTKYGEKYSLKIESKVNKGTRVTVCIPKG